MGKTKYSYEQRLSAVRAVVKKKQSLTLVARRLGCGETPLRRWIARYQEFGSKGLRISRYTYDGDFKLSVITFMHENHLSLSETAAKFGIGNECTISKWERIYYEEGKSGLYRENRGKMKNKPKKPKLKPQVEEDLIAEVQRLRAENAYLKKLKTLVEERIARENESKSSKN